MLKLAKPSLKLKNQNDSLSTDNVNIEYALEINQNQSPDKVQRSQFKAAEGGSNNSNFSFEDPFNLKFNNCVIDPLIEVKVIARNKETEIQGVIGSMMLSTADLQKKKVKKVLKRTSHVILRQITGKETLASILNLNNQPKTSFGP